MALSVGYLDTSPTLNPDTLHSSDCKLYTFLVLVVTSRKKIEQMLNLWAKVLAEAVGGESARVRVRLLP